MSVLSAPRPVLQGKAAISGLILAALLCVCLPGGLAAQPFGKFLSLSGGNAGITVPTSPSLNPTGALTVEAWVFVSTLTADYQDIAGKGWQETWGLFVTPGGKLRSYVRGYVSGDPLRTLREGGLIPVGSWTHVAVVFNGATRFHYINGELAGSWAEPAALTTDTKPVEIGNDPDYPNRTLHGAIDEVRVWNVGRAQTQIQSTLHGFTGSTSTAGLVAFWALDGNANDIFAGHNGSPIAPLSFAQIFSPGSCVPTATDLCLNSRFLIFGTYRVGNTDQPRGTANRVAVSNPGSGLFWFFSPDNWEVMIKEINACGLNSRHWIFSAATTNVFYQLNVIDTVAGVQKIYFNYPGPPAPAVTDTDAFGTCP